jgi:hypothetical protein
MRRWTTALMMLTALMAFPSTAVPQPPAHAQGSNTGHVRSGNRVLMSLIARATEESPTFRRLMNTIAASDGVVYIVPGVCKYGAHACLVKVTSAGNRRYVFVKVYVGRTDRDLMSTIGHELQHAVEVLSNPHVNDFKSLYFMYHKFRRNGLLAETDAAIAAGEAVGNELRRHAAAQ